MHRIISWVIVVVILGAGPALAGDYWGAPLPPDGKIRSETEYAVQTVVQAPTSQVEEFYKQAFQANQDEIYFRQRGGILQIEDYGARPWHKITLVSEPDGSRLVTLSKDSWTWIITMLCSRFLGVFVVLLVLYMCIKLATSLILMSERKANQAEGS